MKGFLSEKELEQVRKFKEKRKQAKRELKKFNNLVDLNLEEIVLSRWDKVIQILIKNSFTVPEDDDEDIFDGNW